MAELNSLPSLLNDAVAYWRMEGNSNDSKGTNNGTDANITYSAGNGKFGQGAGFNGSSSLISLATSTLAQTGDFSVSFWMKRTSTDIGGIIQCWNQYGGDDSFMGWIFSDVSGNGKLVFRTGNTVSGSPPHDLTTTGVVNDGNWHHIVGTYVVVTKTKAIYVDGQPNATDTTVKGIGYTSAAAKMGTYWRNGVPFGYFTGSMDDPAIFSRALTAAEVLTLYKEQSSSGFFALLGGL